MRNIETKITGDSLPADAFNSDQSEFENAVLSSDQTLDPDAGPDTDLNMLGKAMAAYGNAANIYQDSGAANAYVLAIASNLKSVTKYYDNMMIVFKAGNTNTGASTVNVNALGVKSITLPDGTALSASDIVSGEYVEAVYSLSNDRFEVVLSGGSGTSKGVIQVVHTQDGAAASFGSNIPYDDTIPQITEGGEYMTAIITPKSATNKLLIEVVFNMSLDTVSKYATAALFKDATANALAAAASYVNTADTIDQISFKHEMTAGTASAITFRVRAGGEGPAVMTFNGAGGARKLGGVMASSLRVTEYKV